MPSTRPATTQPYWARPRPPPPGVSIVTTSSASRSTVALAGSSRPFRRLRPGAPAPPPRAPLGDQRQPARLDHAQLADDAVAAAPFAVAAGADPERIPLDAERVLQLE